MKKSGRIYGGGEKPERYRARLNKGGSYYAKCIYIWYIYMMVSHMVSEKRNAREIGVLMCSQK